MDRNFEVFDNKYTIDNSGIKFSSIHADVHIKQSNGVINTIRIGVVFTMDGILPEYMQQSRKSNLLYFNDQGMIEWAINTWTIPPRTDEMTNNDYLDKITSEFTEILECIENHVQNGLNGAPIEFDYD